jgi:hypothetical protein
MLKKLVVPLLLAVGIAGTIGGVSYAAARSHSSSNPVPAVTSQTPAQATPTATTRSGCPHMGSGNTTSSSSPASFPSA